MRELSLAHGPVETEVKIRLSADKNTMAQRLEAVGFQVSRARVFEANTLYDTPSDTLRQGGTLLRLRRAGDRAVVTWKGPKSLGQHKSRLEHETSIGSEEILHAILTEIGFQASFRYEKFRTEYQDAAGEGVVTVDETPIGLYLELEGGGDWIDSTARLLGFSEADYILDSYGKLYLDDCKKRQAEPGNMTFDPSEQG